ncbi:MAG: hypothetical protein J5666_06165, partial [Bacilli bacterium]|nr:hypothetical protein [Bacilli bacterium]
IDIFTTFEATIRQYETVEVQNEIEKVLSGDASQEEIESKKTQIKLINDESKAGMPEDQLAREKSLFLRINKNLDAFAEGSLYNKLEKECKLAANDIWNLTKTKLVDEFFAPDLSTVSSDTIEQSITSDALFNNIFIINILINAGVDEDLEDIINYYTVNGSDEYNNAIDDYDEIRTIMRLGYDKVYQMYTNMKKKNIDYKVNEYTLSFTETFSNDLRFRVQELRRARIRVFSLLPLLVKTKTSMSDFVIRYPQFDMQIYLEMILDNRMHDKNGNTLWIWEDSGYSTSSNFYFLSALNDFYGYYNKYELEYSKNAYKNREAKQKIEIECIEKSKASGEIFDLNQKLKDAFEQIEKVKEENEKLLEEVNKLKNDPLRKTLTDFIYNAIKDEIENIISNLFNDVAANITKDAMSKSTSKKDGTPVEVEDNPFEKSVQSLFTAMIKESMIDTIYQIDPSAGAENIDRKVRNMERRTSKDVKNLLLYYLAQVYRGGDGDDGGSDFVSTKGYEGIKDVLQEQDAKKEALKNKKD